MPLIPGFVGCGFLTGLLGIVKFYDPALLALAPLRILLLAGSAIFQSMNILVGWNAAKVFGGSPVIGGILGALISHPGLADLTLYGMPLTPGRGGVFAVLLVTLLAAYGEKQLRKIVPPAFDLFVTPTLVILVMSLLALYVLQPVGGFLAETIGRGATEAVERGGAVTGFLLGGFFLPLVMMGVHQGLTPIHAELISQFGYTILLPILAMAGAGQVGAALAVYVKTRNPRLKRLWRRPFCRRHGRRRASYLRCDPSFGPALYRGLHWRSLGRRCGSGLSCRGPFHGYFRSPPSAQYDPSLDVPRRPSCRLCRRVCCRVDPGF